MKHSAGWFTSRVWMGAVFLFLYLPIFTLVLLSFNASPMVTNWGGWSLRWYSALAHDTEIIAGFKLSLQIAALTACSSVVLGTLIGQSYNGTVLPLATGFAILSLASIAMMTFADSGKPPMPVKL